MYRAADTGEAITGDIARAYITQCDFELEYESTASGEVYPEDTPAPTTSGSFEWSAYADMELIETPDAASIFALGHFKTIAKDMFKKMFPGVPVHLYIFDSGSTCCMTQSTAELLGLIVVDLPTKVSIIMGSGQVHAKQAGLLMTCEPRVPGHLAEGVYTELMFCMLVPEFDNPNMTLISVEQMKRCGSGYDSGVVSGTAGHRYVNAVRNVRDLASTVTNPNTGLVCRVVPLCDKKDSQRSHA